MVLCCDLVSHFLTEMRDRKCWHQKAGIFYLIFSQKMGLMATAAPKWNSFHECPPQVSYSIYLFILHDVNMTSLSRSWHWWAVTAYAACVVRLGAVVDWWRSWAMANTLACLCSCQWWAFWTYLVTVSLFSLYLMNFLLHTMLDAVGNIVRVHYKSIKCDVSFSQGSVSIVFTWGEHVFVYV